MSNVVITEKISSSGSYASLDAKYGPYASVAAANTALGQSGADCIAAGLTVGILENGAVVEYWYQNVNGSLQLVEKQTAAGVTDYADLENKPQINSVALSGNKSSSDLGLQNQLVSGTTIKTINGQSVLGGGNLNTANGYIYADDMDNAPTASADYASKILLIPSTSEEGGMNQYACILDAVIHGVGIQGWSWVLIGTTAPIVSVQEVDATQSKIPFEIKDLYLINASGQEVSNSVGALFKYDVEGVDKVFVTGKSWVTTDSGSFRDFLCWYDTNGNYLNDSLSSEYRCQFNTTRADLTNVEYPVPQDAKTLILNIAHSYINDPIPAVLIQTIVPQSLVKEQVTPNTIIYGTVSIDVDMPLDATSNSEITRATRQSAFGIMFPQSYNNIGRPTPVIAMLHGSNGYVSSSVLGYPEDSAHTGWTNWKQQYLDAGFAVMDINGYGVSSSNDQYSKPFGNPMCVETLFKAFNLIKDLYNVKDKLLLHGTSMGGTNAMSFLKTHPELVSGAALFAPALAPYYVHIIVPDKGYAGADVAAAWGYADWSEMDSDGCSKMIGYSPMMEDDFYWVGDTINKQSYQLLSAKTRLANIPIRIWHGDSDQNVYYEQSVKLVDLLKRSNTPVSLRTCVGGAHNIGGGAAEYVRNEAVSWFKRFVV